MDDNTNSLLRQWLRASRERMTQAEIDEALCLAIEADKRELERLRRIESAARNLIAQRGRHNTEIAYGRLVEALKGE